MRCDELTVPSTRSIAKDVLRGAGYIKSVKAGLRMCITKPEANMY